MRKHYKADGERFRHHLWRLEKQVFAWNNSSCERPILRLCQ